MTLHDNMCGYNFNFKDRLENMINKLKDILNKIRVSLDKINKSGIISIIVLCMTVTIILIGIFKPDNTSQNGVVSNEVKKDIQNSNDATLTLNNRTLTKSDRIKIKFDSIQTTAKEYKMLEKYSNQFVYNTNGENSDTADADIRVNIQDDTFIDEPETELTEISSEELESDLESETVELESSEDLESETVDETVETTVQEETDTRDKIYETGPIYINNSLLIRYISEKGELSATLAQYKYNSDEISENSIYYDNSILVCNVNNYIIRICNKYDIGSLVNDEDKSSLDEVQFSKNELNLLPEVDNGEQNKDYLTEEEYIDTIKEILSNMINKESNSNSNSEYEKYFTESEYTEIMNKISLSNKISTEYKINAIGFGKSDLKNKTKDRLVLYITNENKSKNNSQCYIVILKLDKNNRIYDVDLV